MASAVAFRWEKYAASQPLLVTASGIIPVEAIEREEDWIERLSRAQGVKGIVLPLELSCGLHRRQELMGVELLEWLRWSAPEPVRLVPVLALAWQSLGQILRRKPNSLLTSKGTFFLRLPEAAQNCWERVNEFAAAIIGPNAPRYAADPESIERAAFGFLSQATRITHHDLANEYYAAWRLWQGYRKAVEAAGSEFPGSSALRAESDRLATIHFVWQEELERRMLRPSYRQFQAARREWEFPAYPPVEDANRILRFHVESGLPPVTRVLFVDDDFDKGLAEVLLHILFGPAAFQWRRDAQEWVYAEQGERGSWARFVCVKDVANAARWLRRWYKELDLSEFAANDDEVWLRDWAQALGHADARDVSCILDNIDSDAAMPPSPQTIVLLDLRLSGDKLSPLYAAEQMGSVRLRDAIKASHPDFPVIIFTASRQAANFAAVMAGAREVDGWLIKEAPDVPADDENSSRAVHYLLERFHLYACLRDWYRPEMNWKPEWKLKFHRWRTQPQYYQWENWVSQKATEIFTDWTQNGPPRATLYKSIQERLKAESTAIPPEHRDLAIRLVARRVTVATLLHTANWHNGPIWDLPSWAKVIPVRLDPQSLRYPSDAVNFHEQLWLRSYQPDLLRILLTCEYKWLSQQNWTRNRDAILSVVRQALPECG